MRCLNPLDYELFVQLMNKFYLILTDSGGIQEEAAGKAGFGLARGYGKTGGGGCRDGQSRGYRC